MPQRLSDNSGSAAQTRGTAPPGEGDAAFAALYREYYGFVWRSIRRLGAPQAYADDLAQEVFIVAHRNLATFEGRSKLSTWLFTIAYRTVRDHRRSGEARQRREEAAGAARPPTTPDRKLSRREAARLLDGLLDELGDDHRDVFVMAEVAKMSAPEIAEAIGANINTVYSRIRAARRRFEELLSGYLATGSGSVPWMR